MPKQLDVLSDEVFPTKRAFIVALLIGLVEAIRHARPQPLPLGLQRWGLPFAFWQAVSRVRRRLEPPHRATSYP
ncbi:hypothetical protein [Pannonibacter sp.]|uniref:hypothetical protein n=1 Tax=Pannonibacter sp. TaxID=1906786 RepID=UPI003F6EAD03